MGQVVPLRFTRTPQINWDQIETVRQREFPKIPRKALEIIKAIMDRRRPETPHGEMFIADTDDDFDLNIIKADGDILWLLYLLDRLGGELRYRDLKCTIRRPSDDRPLFIIQPLTDGMRDAANFAFGREYEHVAFSSEWQVLGKELSELKIMFFIIEQKVDPQAKFLGILDIRTARMVFRRMEGRVPVEKALQLYHRHET